ncbi:MAG TPA: response regulator [Tepidisphaeraceae bacterium]|nr:response regulator [Tepidisphaeraceae bacterium]
MLSILIADDEAFLLHILAEKIGRVGHRITTASDGQQAFDLASQIIPDLIITDFQMPVMTGLEMSTKLRQQLNTANIPILLVTARGHRVESNELACTNIVAVIAKPFSTKELLAKVEQLANQIEERRGSKASAA